MAIRKLLGLLKAIVKKCSVCNKRSWNMASMHAFPEPSTPRLDNGYRDFDETANERVRTIQLYFGLGLIQIRLDRSLIAMENTLFLKRIRSVRRSSLSEEKLQEVEEQVTTLDAVRSRLQERIATFKWMKTTSSPHNGDAYSSPAKAETLWESADELNTLP